jgi:DNA mismatch repair protein MutL
MQAHRDDFRALGFEIDDFGEDAFAIRSVPTDLYGLTEKELFLTILDELVEFPAKGDSDAVLSKIASMSCKAAVKGNQKISMQEAEVLMKELLACENPFNCPHGRPTMISMTKYEMEKKFKR